jgi:hypothetical protein
MVSVGRSGAAFGCYVKPRSVVAHQTRELNYGGEVTDVWYSSRIEQLTLH